MTTKHLTWRGERWGLYGDGYWRIGGRYLHREKWEALRGPIPKGWVVHHIDHDRSNSKIGNLECMPKSKHSKHHQMDGHLYTEAATEKRRKWWSENKAEVGKKISIAHAKRKRQLRSCGWCKKSFVAFNTYTKLCGNSCHTNKRYHSGIDNEVRTCISCDKSFSVNKHKKTRVCGRSCGTIMAACRRRR